MSRTLVVKKQDVLFKLANMGLHTKGETGLIVLSAIQRAELDKYLSARRIMLDRTDVIKDDAYIELVPYAVITDDLGNIIGYSRHGITRTVGFREPVQEDDLIDVVTHEVLRTSVALCNRLWCTLQSELDTNFVPLRFRPSFSGIIYDKRELALVYVVSGLSQVFRAWDTDVIRDLTLLDPMTTPRSQFDNWSKLVLDNAETILSN